MWIRQPTLALKSRGDVTRNPKQGYQWPQKWTCMSAKSFKEKLEGVKISVIRILRRHPLRLKSLNWNGKKLAGFRSLKTTPYCNIIITQKKTKCIYFGGGGRGGAQRYMVVLAVKEFIRLESWDDRRRCWGLLQLLLLLQFCILLGQIRMYEKVRTSQSNFKHVIDLSKTRAKSSFKCCDSRFFWSSFAYFGSLEQLLCVNRLCLGVGKERTWRGGGGGGSLSFAAGNLFTFAQ